MSAQFIAAQDKVTSGGNGGSAGSMMLSMPGMHSVHFTQGQQAQAGGGAPQTFQFQYRMDSPPPPPPQQQQQQKQGVQQNAYVAQTASSPFVPQQQTQMPQTPKSSRLPIQSPNQTPLMQQQQIESQGQHQMSASASQLQQHMGHHLQSLQMSANRPASGGQQQQLRQPMLERQYSQGSQSAVPQSPTITRSSSNASASPQHVEADRILHLYIHEYCLKRNYLKSANAIALETGVRTDEGVPLGGDRELGLLSEWFRAFWESYSRTVARPEQQQAQLLPNPQCSPPFSQQNSPFSAITSGHGIKQSANGADGFGHYYGGPYESSMARSNEMRRTGTEPDIRSGLVTDRMASMMGSGSMTPSPFGTGGSAAARFWGGGGSREQAEDTVMQQMTPRTLSRETAASMQRLGWEGRPIESLTPEEKSRLGQVVRQSQIAQRIQSGGGSPISQTTMSGAGLSVTSSADSWNGRSTCMTDSSLTQNDAHTGGSSNPNKKSPNQGAIQRKKRRSSVNLQALSQIQGNLQSANGNGNAPPNPTPPGQRNGGTDNAVKLPPPMSPLTAARKFEEHQHLAKQLQTQSQSILKATNGGGGGGGNASKQQATMPTSNVAKRRANASAKSQQAQSEAQIQATSQISAQIQQLQQRQQQKHLQRTGNGGVPSGEDGQTKGSQISQLRILQGKLSQNARSAIDAQEQEQQQAGRRMSVVTNGNDVSSNGRPSMHRATSSQGVNIVPLVPTSPSAGMAMGPPLSAPATPISFMQQQMQHHQQQLQQLHNFKPSSSPMMPGLFNGLQNRSGLPPGHDQSASSPFTQSASLLQERQQMPMASPQATVQPLLGPPLQPSPSHQQQAGQQHAGRGGVVLSFSPAFSLQSVAGSAGEHRSSSGQPAVEYDQQQNAGAVNGLGLGLAGGEGGISHAARLGSPMALQAQAQSMPPQQQQGKHGMHVHMHMFDGGAYAQQQHGSFSSQDAQQSNTFQQSPDHHSNPMAGFDGQFLSYGPGPNNNSTNNLAQFDGGGGGGFMDQNWMQIL